MPRCPHTLRWDATGPCSLCAGIVCERTIGAGRDFADEGRVWARVVRRRVAAGERGGRNARRAVAKCSKCGQPGHRRTVCRR